MTGSDTGIKTFSLGVESRDEVRSDGVWADFTFGVSCSPRLCSAVLLYLSEHIIEPQLLLFLKEKLGSSP